MLPSEKDQETHSEKEVEKAPGWDVPGRFCSRKARRRGFRRLRQPPVSTAPMASGRMGIPPLPKKAISPPRAMLNMLFVYCTEGDDMDHTPNGEQLGNGGYSPNSHCHLSVWDTGNIGRGSKSCLCLYEAFLMWGGGDQIDRVGSIGKMSCPHQMSGSLWMSS